MGFAMTGILCIAGAAAIMGVVMMISVLWDEKKDRKRENKRTN